MENQIVGVKDIFVCQQCGGTNVQNRAWVDANTNEIIDHMSNDNEDTWCEDCQGHTGIMLRSAFEEENQEEDE